jgi:hypothetical protein
MLYVKRGLYQNMVSIAMIILAISVIVASTLTQYGKIAAAQDQGNDTTSTPLTPEQRAAMCDPNNPSSKLKSVNTTESRVCGLPKTSSSNITSPENITSEGITPSMAPPLFTPEG